MSAAFALQGSEDAEIEARAAELAQGSRAALSVAEGCLALAGAAVLRIPAWRFEAAEALIAKATRRSAKLGLEAPRLTVAGVSVRTWTETLEGGVERFRREERATIAVFGSAPKVAGFRFVARVEHTEAGNVVTRAPFGVEAGVDLRLYRTAAPDCKHCGAARRRKDTFVLQGEDGALVQIGRNCLADFIRSTDVKEGLALWQLLRGLSSFGGSDEERPFDSARVDFGTLEFVACAVRSIAIDGFHKSLSEGRSTKGAAFFALGPLPREPEIRKDWQHAQPTAADFTRAEAVLAWVAGTTDSSDYVHNLRVACALPTVGRRGGLLASAPIAFSRAMEREAEAARRAQRPKPPAGAHLGEIGERLDLGALIVLRVRYVENDWGTKTIVALEDEQANQITWFATGARDFDAGEKLEGCRGTVKKHEEYKGRKQTVVSRLTWKDPS